MSGSLNKLELFMYQGFKLVFMVLVQGFLAIFVIFLALQYKQLAKFWSLITK